MNTGTEGVRGGVQGGVVVARAGAKRAPRSEGSSSERRARELVITASHDLRSPLVVIKLQLQRIERRRQLGDEPSATEWSRVTARIERATDYAFELIDDLLAVERLHQRGRATIPSTGVDIEEIVTSAISLQSESLEKARCDVSVSRRRGFRGARGFWDRGHLLRIFSNLLRNVCRHAPGAPIRVILGRLRDRLRIVFTDRGPGIRVRPGTPLAGVAGDTAAHSFGLGLWIVQRAVEGLAGSLRIRNRPGLGLTFEIELPGIVS